MTYTDRSGTLTSDYSRAITAGLYYKQHYDDINASSLTLKVEARLVSTTVAPITAAEPTLADAGAGPLHRLQSREPVEPASQFTALITWPDSSTSDGHVVSDGSGGFNVLPEAGGHPVDDPGGAHTVAVTDNDIDGGIAGTTSSGSTLTISDLSISGSGGAPGVGDRGP